MTYLDPHGTAVRRAQERIVSSGGSVNTTWTGYLDASGQLRYTQGEPPAGSQVIIQPGTTHRIDTPGIPADIRASIRLRYEAGVRGIPITTRSIREPESLYRAVLRYDRGELERRIDSLRNTLGTSGNRPPLDSPARSRGRTDLRKKVRPQHKDEKPTEKPAPKVNAGGIVLAALAGLFFFSQ